MAEEEKMHVQQESVATFVMKGQYKTFNLPAYTNKNNIGTQTGSVYPN